MFHTKVNFMPPDISFVLGTRPEIIKLSPIIRECERRDIEISILHTGQHYSENLDRVFFEQLRLPEPDHNLEVGSAPHGRQTGEMMAGIESVLEDESPEYVFVQGDTNSVLAGSVAACKMESIEVCHVEAGLRSYDMEMPEEINRRLSDHVSDHHFAPTEESRDNLLAENIPETKITVTGNTIVDAVEENTRIAREESDVLDELGLDGPFALLTAHRAENVDNEKRFVTLLEGVSRAARKHDLTVVYPIHPRAKERVSEFSIDVPSEIKVVEPQEFLDFLVLEAEAEVVFTDSGGVQEETCVLRTPCVTLRDNTERPETVDVGANLVVGVKPDDIIKGADKMMDRDRDWKNPFGDGTAAKKILDTLGLKGESGG